jgi:3-deoxy-D-manno-octulosonate 8-phosphate phosphatase KdsC-like HAD superfamily phosphatase
LPGGHGAVREVCDYLLTHSGLGRPRLTHSGVTRPGHKARDR